MGRTESITQAFSALCFLAAGLLFAGRVYSSVSSTGPLAQASVTPPRVTQAQNQTLIRSPDLLAPFTPLKSSRWLPLVGRRPESSAASPRVQPVTPTVLPVARSMVNTLPAGQGRPAETANLAVVDLSDRRVYLYRGDQALADYPIAVGRQHWETPVGEFKIIEKQENPTWRHPFTRELVPPGADNPLGSHWIGFWSNGTHQIGFHGTNQVEAIGQAVSHGCIRMRNSDVQALYAVLPLGAAIAVQQ
ncbi:MAG: L,D-transpeptidase [Elainellaceae cyanobacterium]